MHSKKILTLASLVLILISLLYSANAIFATTTITIPATVGVNEVMTTPHQLLQQITANVSEIRTTPHQLMQQITANVSELRTSPQLLTCAITNNVNELMTTPHQLLQTITNEIYELRTLTIPQQVLINATNTINEYIPGGTPASTTSAPPLPTSISTTLPHYTITNPFRSGLTCAQVSPLKLNDNLYQYNTSGLFYVYVNNTNATINIYPNNYGNYQTVCQNLYYCGFRAYVSMTYINNSKTLHLIVSIPQLPQNTVEKYWSSVVDAFELYLNEKTEDFSGIGSLIVWLLHITIYSNSTVFAETEVPVWSAFYQTESSMLPFPVAIYSNTNSISVYDCQREFITAICPSNNPLVCALWGFFRIVYDLLLKIFPEPVRALFSFVGVLGSVISNMLSVLGNPLFLSIVMLLLPLLLLTLVYTETLGSGGFGLVNVFIQLFEYIKHIAEFIIKLIRSVLPF